MILAIDVGNTQILTGCIEGAEIRHIARMETRAARTEYEYAVVIEHILEFAGIERDGFEGAIVSSVVPGLTAIIKKAVRMLTGREAMVVGSGIKTGLNILIDDPAQLGSDMVVISVAALARYKAPIIIFDMDTATTVSVIDAKGNYLGGAILPGVALSLSALTGATAQLPDVPLEAPKRAIGKNTIACMQSGAVYGAASALDGMIDRMQAELAAPATLIATGDLALQIIPHCRHSICHDPDLLMRGLGLIYHRKRREKK